MSQPFHTPGPVKTYNPAAGCKNDGLYWQILESRKDEVGARKIIASDMSKDYCHLLAAAYNAFDSAARALNCNAVELAERMRKGEIAHLFFALKELLSRFRSAVGAGGEIEGDKEAILTALEAIAKVSGGAHG